MRATIVLATISFMYSFKTNDTIDRLTLVLLNVPILYATIGGGARGGVTKRSSISCIRCDQHKQQGHITVFQQYINADRFCTYNEMVTQASATDDIMQCYCKSTL